MKSGALVFLAAFAALSASWGGFVLAPQIQLGRADQAKTVPAKENYPLGRPGLAKQGAEVYRSLGCVYCHSQQVGQTGAHCEIILTDAGTNTTATLAVIARLNAELAKSGGLAGLPKTILQVADMNIAKPIVKELLVGGGKAEARVIPFGPDIERGWGKRASVAQDYLFDYPVQPGTRRIGPDLANVGAGKPDVNWHLRHLYAPPAMVTGSTMPPYRFLFETRRVVGKPTADALQLPAEFAPKPGWEIVPKDEARALAAYLASLRADAPLFEAPFTAPYTAPAVAVTNAAATNSPAK